VEDLNELITQKYGGILDLAKTNKM
jgi:hypothetical protein